jgi:hypothetical protein
MTDYETQLNVTHSTKQKSLPSGVTFNERPNQMFERLKFSIRIPQLKYRTSNASI